MKAGRGLMTNSLTSRNSLRSESAIGRNGVLGSVRLPFRPEVGNPEVSFR